MLSMILFVLTPACQYHVEEELYADTECLTDEVSYSDDIVPILKANCYICHSQALNTGNVTLEGYDDLIKVVESGRLLGAIRREPGFAPMPQNQPMLSDCTIEKIAAWVGEGAPEN